MQRGPDGFHVAQVEGVRAGDRYAYRIGDGPVRPDPASRFQPNGVHGPSQVVDRQFDWTDQDWQSPSREDWVIYELHVGAFTAEGTYAAAIDRLDELVELGITAIELMPLADCAGRWNWGYDGVHLFAPQPSYGTPAELRRFVDAAHARGLSVFLDVVYNHLGPEGNYWGDYGCYLSDIHQTAWGSGPAFDDPAHGQGLRRFVIANAIYWLDEYHFDGLRIDAIHCMLDRSEPHVVRELADDVGCWTQQSGRSAHLIAESNVYDPEMLAEPSEGGIGFDAQWCDDFLHSVFAVVRPGEKLCSRDYQPGSDLSQTLTQGFVYQGTLRESRKRVQLNQRVETHGLIYSIQNHDFVGNHPLGKRLHQLTSPETQKAAATLLILSPAIPMLFMGEEFACEHPFRFFVDFGDPELRRAVVEGRKAEYPQHDWTEGVEPIDPTAFESSKIGPSNQGDSSMLEWYRSLIALRKEWRQRGLLSDDTLQTDCDPQTGLYVMRYSRGSDRATVAARLNTDAGRPDVAFACDDPVRLRIRDERNTADCLCANDAIVFDAGRSDNA